MNVEEELGALVGRHETNNGRRGVFAVVALLLGLAMTGLGIVTARLTYGTPVNGDDGIPSLLLGCGLGLLLFGFGWQGSLFVTRSGEAFELYEGGIVHRFGRKARTLRWGEIGKITGGGKNTALARALGGDLTCRIRPTAGGRAMVITGLTEQAAELVEAVWQARGQQP